MNSSRIQRIAVAGWKGGTFGLRVRKESRERVLRPVQGRLRQVRLDLPGLAGVVQCRVTPTFWTTCPSLRSAEIGRWMEARGDMPWPYRQPPQYGAELVRMDGDTATIRVAVE